MTAIRHTTELFPIHPNEGRVVLSKETGVTLTKPGAKVESGRGGLRH